MRRPLMSSTKRERMPGGSGMSERDVIALPRHGRARPGHPRILCRYVVKTWMPGTRPGMTNSLCTQAPLHPHHRLRPITIAQMPLHQFAGGRARQLGLEVDAARAFDRRQVLAAEQD